nr:hypothetical protein [Klebsiella aerogenes]
MSSALLLSLFFQMQLSILFSPGVTKLTGLPRKSTRSAPAIIDDWCRSLSR